MENITKPSKYNFTKLYTVSYLRKSILSLEKKTYQTYNFFKTNRLANQSDDKSDSTNNNSGSDRLQRNDQRNSAFHN